MSEQIDKLNAEVTELDTNEQREESDIAALNAEVTNLKQQLADAQNSGDAAAIQAATDKLHNVNERIKTLLDAENSPNAQNT